MEKESLSRMYYWVGHRAWLIFDFERWSSQRLYKWLLLRTVPPGEGMAKMYCLTPILHKFTLDCTCVGSKIHFGLCLCGCSAGSCSLSPLQVNRKNLGWEARKKHPKQVQGWVLSTAWRTPESMHHTGTGQERGGAESVEVIRKVIDRHTNYVFCNRNI